MIIRQVCKGCSMYWVGAAPTDMKLYVRWVQLVVCPGNSGWSRLGLDRLCLRLKAGGGWVKTKPIIFRCCLRKVNNRVVRFENLRTHNSARSHHHDSESEWSLAKSGQRVLRVKSQPPRMQVSKPLPTRAHHTTPQHPSPPRSSLLTYCIISKLGLGISQMYCRLEVGVITCTRVSEPIILFIVKYTRCIQTLPVRSN